MNIPGLTSVNSVLNALLTSFFVKDDRGCLIPIISVLDIAFWSDLLDAAVVITKADLICIGDRQSYRSSFRTHAKLLGADAFCSSSLK